MEGIGLFWLQCDKITINLNPALYSLFLDVNPFTYLAQPIPGRDRMLTAGLLLFLYYLCSFYIIGIYFYEAVFFICFFSWRACILFSLKLQQYLL
jgi:hypothetical protein